MAKQSTTTDVREELKSLYDQAWKSQQNLRDSWSEKEALLLNRNQDQLSSNFKSRVSEGGLSTIIIERAARVMAQLPTGKARPLTKDDAGKAVLMNLVMDRYILPNAKTQFDPLTKLRLADLYSMVYGSMPIFYDYVVSDTYVGPDFWLIPIRDFFWQPGKISIADSDWAMAETIVSAGWLEDRLKYNETWKKDAIAKILERSKDGVADLSSRDTQKQSYVERTRFSTQPGGKGRAAQIRLVTKYESGDDGHWITFAPDFDSEILRDIPNPHKSGKIPIILKHCFPLLDSMIGLGDFERGKTLQYAVDSLINLYLDGVKMSIFPPMMVNAASVVMSSLKYSPAAKWLVKGPNAIQNFPVSPMGLSSFQSTYSFLKAAILNQNGTTDTSVTKETDPGFGKTPQAIAAQQMRESARDNWDRFMMEKVIEELFESMINLLSIKQEKPIQFHLFDAEIKQIANDQGLQDVLEISDSGQTAKVTISKKNIGNSPYKYIVDSSTTMKRDQFSEAQALTQILALLGSPTGPMILQDMQIKGKKIDFGELFKQIIIDSGIQDWENIVVDVQQYPTDALQAPQAPGAVPPPPPGPETQPPGAVGPQGPAPEDVMAALGGAPQQGFQDPHIAAIAQAILGGGQ